MDEYIEREAAVEAICDSKDEDINSFNPITKYNAIYYAIEAIPAADVAPVVRCKDCIHQENCMRQIVFWERDNVLEQNTSKYHKLDFCSYGERRSE